MGARGGVGVEGACGGEAPRGGGGESGGHAHAGGGLWAEERFPAEKLYLVEVGEELGELGVEVVAVNVWDRRAAFAFGTDGRGPVSYTHLTLPAGDLVYNSVVARSFKKKITD